MRLQDQFRMSFVNLWRRKLRTFLTVLGVLIGTVAIVVMLSIGIAQQRFMEQTIGSSRDLLEVTVYPRYGLGGPGADASGEGMLTNKTLDMLSGLEHVKYVTPFLRISCEIQQGKYSCGNGIQAVSREYIDDLDWEYSQGRFPDPEDYEPGTLPLAIGAEFNTMFYDPNGFGPRFGQEDAEPPVDLFAEPAFMLFHDYGSSRGGSEGVAAPPKKYLLQADAVIATPEEGYSPFSWQAYTDIDAAKTFLQQVFRGKAWPGQPQTKTGRSTGELNYDQLIVVSEDFAYTKDILDQVTELGFEAYSNVEFLASMKEQMARVNMFLGGIGGISLLVAAIGIANTMMMSIYERTKEIGIYKVLGCPMPNIRNLFLIEAGLIGLIGGLIGVGLSYLISYGLNILAQNPEAKDSFIMATGEQMSVIPPWLALAAIAFGMLIGMISGLIPALRAMHLSPLAAMHSE